VSRSTLSGKKVGRRVAQAFCVLGLALLLGARLRPLFSALLPALDVTNLDRLSAAMDDLQAEVIAVPPFDARHLEEGLAAHFRCQGGDVQGLAGRGGSGSQRPAAPWVSPRRSVLRAEPSAEPELDVVPARLAQHAKPRETEKA